MRTTELVDDVVQQDDFNDDGGAFGGGGWWLGLAKRSSFGLRKQLDENEEWTNQNNDDLIFVLFLPIQILLHFFKPNSFHENIFSRFLIILINFKKIFVIFKLFFWLIFPPGL
jgi:hypothetical protein